jgi:hypothetical protein
MGGESGVEVGSGGFPSFPCLLSCQDRGKIQFKNLQGGWQVSSDLPHGKTSILILPPHTHTHIRLILCTIWIWICISAFVLCTDAIRHTPVSIPDSSSTHYSFNLLLISLASTVCSEDGA